MVGWSWRRRLPVIVVAAGLITLVELRAAVTIQHARHAVYQLPTAAVITVVAAGAIAAVAAIGLWRVRYWAIVGFEIVLGFAVVFFSLFLLLASNVLALVICIAVIGFGGWLFWSLVRPMARVQMRDRAVE